MKHNRHDNFGIVYRFLDEMDSGLAGNIAEEIDEGMPIRDECRLGRLRWDVRDPAISLEVAASAKFACVAADLFADISSRKNVIWREDGFAGDYSFRYSRIAPWDRSLFGAVPIENLSNLNFVRIDEGWQGSVDGSLQIPRKLAEVLIQPVVRLIETNPYTREYRPGKANRNIHREDLPWESTDYVVVHPATGELWLTPHGVYLLHSLEWQAVEYFQEKEEGI